MITGDLKNKVDSIWDTLWTGGITSPITVLEQITYLMFMKLLDDNQLKQEANANVLGVPLKEENKGSMKQAENHLGFILMGIRDLFCELMGYEFRPGEERRWIREWDD